MNECLRIQIQKNRAGKTAVFYLSDDIRPEIVGTEDRKLSERMSTTL